MKKVLYFAALLFAITLTSCEKEDMGGTATESLAGQWYVQGNVVEDGQVIEDPYGIGRFIILTYNTSANNANEIWIDDIENFWNFKVKATADANGLTFSASSAQTMARLLTISLWISSTATILAPSTVWKVFATADWLRTTKQLACWLHASHLIRKPRGEQPCEAFCCYCDGSNTSRAMR